MLYTSVAIAGHDRVSALGLNPGTETVEASKLIVDTFLPLLSLHEMSQCSFTSLIFLGLIEYIYINSTKFTKS